jgi:hypothetical protein
MLKNYIKREVMIIPSALIFAWQDLSHATMLLDDTVYGKPKAGPFARCPGTIGGF